MLDFELLDVAPERDGRGKYGELLTMFMASDKPAMAVPCVNEEKAKNATTGISAYIRKHDISAVCWRKGNKVMVIRA